ncbi:MAG: glycosyl transferase family protein [Alphaproteobacteria bacterium]
MVEQRQSAGAGRAAPETGGPEAFTRFLRLIARGGSLSRPLERDEAAAAMRMVLHGEAEPLQIGAFLAVMRYRRETPAEIAGFVEAARGLRQVPAAAHADLDWPSYTETHGQLPYFLLAALLLAEAGTRVLIHGIEGNGPATTAATLGALGISLSATADSATRALDRDRLAYLPLGAACPPLRRLFGLRNMLGFRTSANTVARSFNPFNAPCQIQGVFRSTHIAKLQAAALLLGQPTAAIFKGGAGEAQRDPQKECRIAFVSGGAAAEEHWPASHEGTPYPWRNEPLEPARVAALWRGEWRAAAPEAAVIGTAAIALRLTGRAPHASAAERAARELWERRPKTKYGRA